MINNRAFEEWAFDKFIGRGHMAYAIARAAWREAEYLMLKRQISGGDAPAIFHGLWTDCVGKDGYVKAEWMEWQTRLNKEGIVV